MASKPKQAANSKEPDVDEPERLLDALGDELVRLARFGHARRVLGFIS